MHAGEATDEPEHDENDQYEAENAAEPSPAISAIAMVATEAAKQQDHQDDNQDCAHCRPSLRIPAIDSRRSALPAKSLNRYSTDSLNVDGGRIIGLICRAVRPSIRQPHSAPCQQPCRSCLQLPASYRRGPCRRLPSRLPWPAVPNL